MKAINERHLQDENYKGFFLDPMKKMESSPLQKQTNGIQSMDLRSADYRGFPTDNIDLKKSLYNNDKFKQIKK